MRKLILILSIVCLLVACSSNETTKQPTTDSTSVSSSADSIKNAVENSLKDTVLYPTDSVKRPDSVPK